MTEQEIKAEAEKIKQEFLKTIVSIPSFAGESKNKAAKQCAIIHVNGIMGQIFYSIATLKSTDIDFLNHSNDEIKRYRSILTELEKK